MSASDGEPITDLITSLVRPEVLALAPYRSARSESDAARITIYLDANESPYPPFPADGSTDGLNRYPECQPADLLALLAAHLAVPEDQLFLTRGADEAIDLLVRVFCTEGTDGIIITPPTFPMYAHSAAIQGAFVIEAPLTTPGFQLDVARVLAEHADHPAAKLVFVCSPNNPTGNLLARNDILAVAEALEGKALVVVDELYLDYAGRESLATAIGAHPNIVVLRSLSKEYSLAGERIGMTLADPAVIALLQRVTAPYPLPQSVIRAAEAAMTEEGVAYARGNMDRIVAERERVAHALRALPFVHQVFPSDANFLLVQVEEPTRFTATMEAAGIKIRDRSTIPWTRGSVRISIGTPAENDALLAVARDLSA